MFGQKITVLYLVFFTNIFLIFTSLAHAETPNLQLEPTQTVFSVVGFVEYYEDPTHALKFAQARTLYNAGNFAPVTDSIDFGSNTARFWLRMRLENPTNEIQEWVLNTGSQRMRYAAVHYIRGENTETLILDSLTRPFSARPISHRLLLAELTLQPHEVVEVFITYASAKSSYFPLKIMTPEAFAKWDRDQSRMIVLVLGAILVLAIYSAFLFFTVNNLSYIYYLTFVVMTFMYLLHQFGFAYQFFWPNHPYFNSYIAAFFGFSAGISGLLFGRSFFEVYKISRYWDWIYLGLAALFFAASLYLYLWPSGPAIGTFGFMFGTVSAILNVTVAIICYRRGDVSAGIAAFGWSSLIVWGVVINITSFGVLKIPQELIFDNFYMIYAAAALSEVMFLTLSLFVRVRQVIRANHRERQNYIRLLEDEAASAKALAIAIQDRQAAIEDAARKGRLVESMAHDIRQPLHAMRLSNHSAQNSTLNAIANEAMDMIDGVLTTAFAVVETDETYGDVMMSTVTMQQILLPLSLIFTPEARAQKVAFTVIPSSASVFTDRRILVRIMNNLLTNALKHSHGGRVVVGCRRRPDGIALQVVDSGIGMSKAEIATARQPYTQHTNAPDGLGLGLAICEQLCGVIGAELRVSSKTGHGTMVEVFLPCSAS